MQLYSSPAKTEREVAVPRLARAPCSLLAAWLEPAHSGQYASILRAVLDSSPGATRLQIALPVASHGA